MHEEIKKPFTILFLFISFYPSFHPLEFIIFVIYIQIIIIFILFKKLDEIIYYLSKQRQGTLIFISAFNFDIFFLDIPSYRRLHFRKEQLFYP